MTTNNKARPRSGHPYMCRALAARLIHAKEHRVAGDDYSMDGLESDLPELSPVRYKGATDGDKEVLPFREARRNPKPAYVRKNDND